MSQNKHVLVLLYCQKQVNNKGEDRDEVSSVLNDGHLHIEVCEQGYSHEVQIKYSLLVS